MLQAIKHLILLVTILAVMLFSTHHSGELIFDTATESVLGDVNGDGIADFEIELLGVNVMSASDFVL